MLLERYGIYNCVNLFAVPNLHMFTCRVVMRREQILKICLNHMLTADIEYHAKDEKTWLFTAPDFSEGEINHWQFCIRFKTPELAQNFKMAVDEALRAINNIDGKLQKQLF